MLTKARLQQAVVDRWCLAYWMFYHAGVASACAEAQDFWGTVWQAQEEKWPRGTERRHFKGDQSRRAIAELAERYPAPGSAVNYVTGRPALAQRFHEVAGRAVEWRGFGKWIAFKVADMTDALLGVQVDFSQAHADLFEDPLKGARLVAQELSRTPLPEFAETTAEQRQAYLAIAINYLRSQIGETPSPHAPWRPIFLQEYETILCKYKSYVNGRYPVGKDTREISHYLEGWGGLAHQLRHALREATHAPTY